MAADDDFARELEAINAEYRATLPQRLADIDEASLAIREGDAAALRTLLRQLHSIAGSAATFGFAPLGKAAALAEDWIEPYCVRAETPAPAALEELEPLLAAVRRAASA